MLKAAVETESPPVIAAAKEPFVGRRFGDEHAAMGADVAHAMQVVLNVAGEEDWLIEAAFQERKGVHGAGDLYKVGVADELP